MTAKDRMARAEDYVFGLMDEQERARAERDMEVDPDFRACVTQLAERLRMLHRAKGATPMSDKDWSDITARISELPQMGRKDDIADLKALGIRLPDPEQKGLLGIKRPGAQQFAGWRGTVVALALVSAMLIGYYAGQGMASAPHPSAVVLMKNDSSETAAIMEIYNNHRIRLLPLEETAVPEETVLQLWTWQDGNPIPLAVFGNSAETTITGPELSAPATGQTYEFTLEPTPGSASGRPTGTTVLTGEAVPTPR